MPIFALEATGACVVTAVALGILVGVRDSRIGPHAVLQALSGVPALLAFLALSVIAGFVIAFRSPSPIRTLVWFGAMGAALTLPVATSLAVQDRGMEALLVLAVTALATGAVTGFAIVLGGLVARRSRTPSGRSADGAPASG